MRHGAVAAYAGLVWVTTSSSSHGPRAARGCDQFLRSDWAIRHFYPCTAESTFKLPSLARFALHAGAIHTRHLTGRGSAARSRGRGCRRTRHCFAGRVGLARLRTRSEPEGGTTRLDSMAPVRAHRTIPGCPDAYKRCSARNNPRLVRAVPHRRTAACAQRPLRHTARRLDLRRDFDKTNPSASVHAPPTRHTTHFTQSTDSTRSGSG